MRDSPTEKINREFHMLSAITICTRRQNESTNSYANRFDRAVAKYVPHTGNADELEGEQCATLLLENAKLTADTRKSISFQLATSAAVRRQAEVSILIRYRREDVEELIISIEKSQTRENVEAIVSTFNEISTTMRRVKIGILTDQEQDAATITPEDFLAAIRQVRTASEGEERKHVRNMLSKGVSEGVWHAASLVQGQL